MHTKCRKKCKCNECEMFKGNEEMVVIDETFSSGFQRRLMGVCCNNEYRVARNLSELKLGYEESDYVTLNNEIQIK